LQGFSSFGQIKNDEHKIRTIVIDAGHGGRDSGALGKHSKEKDIVLNVSLLAGEYIEKTFPEVNVIYTRKTDIFIPLHQRSNIANDADADLFISIHANANPNTKAYGSETYFMGLHKSDENLEVAQKENSVIVYEENYEARYEGFDPNDVESYIMMSLVTDVYQEQSMNAANFVQTQFRERVKRKDRGVKQAGFLVLWETGMPSILIELGFVSNPTEEKFLISEQGQDYLASAIFRAFREYKNYIEGGGSPAQLIAAEDPKTTIKQTDTVVKPEEDLSDNNTPEELNEELDQANYLSFKVQILYSENPIKLDDAVFKDFNDVQEIITNGRYKYVVGSKSNYNDAVEYSKWVKSRHPDAFVVAVSDGKIIPLSKALEATQNN
jgi:N-acetylmuramoyl-L-alanine amidase